MTAFYACPIPDLRPSPGHYIVPTPPSGLRLLAARAARRYRRLSKRFYRRCEELTTANRLTAATVLAAAAARANHTRHAYELALSPEMVFPATDLWLRR